MRVVSFVIILLSASVGYSQGDTASPEPIPGCDPQSLADDMRKSCPVEKVRQLVNDFENSKPKLGKTFCGTQDNSVLNTYRTTIEQKKGEIEELPVSDCENKEGQLVAKCKNDPMAGLIPFMLDKTKKLYKRTHKDAMERADQRLASAQNMGQDMCPDGKGNENNNFADSEDAKKETQQELPKSMASEENLPDHGDLKKIEDMPKHLDGRIGMDPETGKVWDCRHGDCTALSEYDYEEFKKQEATSWTCSDGGDCGRRIIDSKSQDPAWVIGEDDNANPQNPTIQKVADLDDSYKKSESGPTSWSSEPSTSKSNTQKTSPQAQPEVPADTGRVDQVPQDTGKTSSVADTGGAGDSQNGGSQQRRGYRDYTPEQKIQRRYPTANESEQAQLLEAREQARQESLRQAASRGEDINSARTQRNAKWAGRQAVRNTANDLGLEASKSPHHRWVGQDGNNYHSGGQNGGYPTGSEGGLVNNPGGSESGYPTSSPGGSAPDGSQYPGDYSDPSTGGGKLATTGSGSNKKPSSGYNPFDQKNWEQTNRMMKTYSKVSGQQGGQNGSSGGFGNSGSSQSHGSPSHSAKQSSSNDKDVGEVAMATRSPSNDLEASQNQVSGQPNPENAYGSNAGYGEREGIQPMSLSYEKYTKPQEDYIPAPPPTPVAAATIAAYHPKNIQPSYVQPQYHQNEVQQAALAQPSQPKTTPEPPASPQSSEFNEDDTYASAKAAVATVDPIEEPEEEKKGFLAKMKDELVGFFMEKKEKEQLEKGLDGAREKKKFAHNENSEEDEEENEKEIASEEPQEEEGGFLATIADLTKNLFDSSRWFGAEEEDLDELAYEEDDIYADIDPVFDTVQATDGIIDVDAQDLSVKEKTIQQLMREAGHIKSEGLVEELPKLKQDTDAYGLTY